MALVGLRVPHEIARIFADLDIPGERENTPHITMFYLDDELGLDAVAKAMVVAAKVLETQAPFTVATRLITTFQRGKNGIPVICKIESPELHRLHATMGAAFDAAGVEFSKKWPEFKPHMTLGYSQEPFDDRRIPLVTWPAEPMIWGGDSGEARLFVTFPLSLGRVGIAARVASRFGALLRQRN